MTYTDIFSENLNRYRFQYDGRLQRSLETGRFCHCLHQDLVRNTMGYIAVMLMETFDRLSRKEKYVWDVS
jgi:hypothetical protein